MHDLNTTHQIIAKLTDLYPKCFNKDDIKPLKLGMVDDVTQVLDNEFSKTEIKKAIQYYTNNWNYLRSFKKHTHRYDIDGNPVQDISKEHIDFSINKLKFLQKRALDKKKSLVKDKSLDTSILEIGKFVTAKIAGKNMKVKIADISLKQIKVESQSGMQFTLTKDKIFSVKN